MELEKRKEMVEMGMDYLRRASELRPDYFEATSYINLLYREKAKLAQLAGNMEDVMKYTQEADKFMRLSLEQRKKVMAKKG